MVQVEADQLEVIKTELNEKNKIICNFIDSSTDFISIVDKFGNRKFINKSAQRFLGFDLNLLIGSPVFAIVHEDDRQALSDLWLQLPNIKSISNFQNRVVQNGGSVAHMCWTFNWDDETECIYTIGKDITSLKKAEEQLIQSERQFRDLIMNLNVGVMKQGPQAEILIANKKALALLGLTEDQLMGKSSFDADWNVIDEAGNTMLSDTHPVPMVLATKKAVENIIMGVYRPITKDRIWLLVNAVPEIDIDGNIAYVICTFIDMTERKQSEKFISESEKRFKAIFADAPLGIALGDSITGRYYEVNPKYAEIIGRSLEELNSINWMSITHPDDILPDLTKMELLVKGEINGFQMEKRYIHPDGSIVWVNMTISSLIREENMPLRHLCMVEDITSKKQVKEKLKNIAWKHSHEIRGPLTSIMGIVAAMNYKISLDEKLMLLGQLDHTTKKLDEAIHSIIDETHLA